MAHVKLILVEDVENLGLAGEEVSVTAGFARNYLLPRKLAAKADPGTLRQLASRREKIEARRQADAAAAEALKAKLAELEVTIVEQATADDQLFGSVSARAISEALAAQGIKIEHSRIRIEEPIKALGEFTVQAKLHATVTAPVKVVVKRV
ncbi:MAG: 50S ribosomal protein L9 [Victivallaceae bacterium]|nr:50S ribosomal protein L9 [Victivallaceae bacterium]